MNVLSLFSGIGGIELGLEAAGMTVVGQVEIDDYCRQVLAHHWPEVPRHDDVRTAPAWWLADPERPVVDVVAGGFPCQPFSTTGLRRGIADERWGWPWMFDVIRTVRPRYVLVENVAALTTYRDAFGWLLGDLAELGLDAEWGVLPACALGAPHSRRRVCLVAFPQGSHGREGLGSLDPVGWASLQTVDRRSRLWRDEVDRSIETSRADSRETDGSAARMVKAGGNAVVPVVAEYIGRLIQVRAAEVAA